MILSLIYYSVDFHQSGIQWSETPDGPALLWKRISVLFYIAQKLRVQMFILKFLIPDIFEFPVIWYFSGFERAGLLEVFCIYKSMLLLSDCDLRSMSSNLGLTNRFHKLLQALFCDICLMMALSNLIRQFSGMAYPYGVTHKDAIEPQPDWHINTN